MRKSIVSLVCGCAVLAGAGSAVAGLSPNQYDYRDVASPAYLSSEKRSIKCGGTRYPFMLAGGFTFSTLFEGNPQPSRGVAISSAPIGDRKWSLEDFNYDPDVGGSGPRISALCGKRDPGYSVEADETRILPGAVGTVITRCRPSEQAVSAGWVIEGYGAPSGAEILIVESYRVDDRSWRMSGTNVGNASGKLEMKLNCSSSVPKLREMSIPTWVEAGQSTDAVGECKKGKTGYSAGFDALPGGSAPVGYAYGLSPLIGGVGWFVSLAGLDGVSGASPKTYTYCGAQKYESG